MNQFQRLILLLCGALLLLGIAMIIFFLTQMRGADGDSQDTLESTQTTAPVAVTADGPPLPLDRASTNATPDSLPGIMPLPETRPETNLTALPVAADSAEQVQNRIESFVRAINADDTNSLYENITGFEAVSERIRDAALNDTEFLTRSDLRARHKFTVLALRQFFTREQIANLPVRQVIEAHTGEESVLITPGQRVTVNEVSDISNGSATATLVLGTQAETFSLIQTEAGWRVDLSQVFDPQVVTAQDQAILELVALQGADDAGWLAAYADVSGEPAGEGLLQLP